jgi:DNA-binding Lrp family transcriptional regulator
MLIYANTSSRREYVHWDKSTQIRLAGYNIAWYPSEVAHRQLGFFPLRNETIERMEIQPKYKEMLKLLNMNSRASFQELSKKLGMHFNTLAYNFRKLQGKDWIKRFTISMKPIPDTTIMSFFGKYVLSNSFEKDAAKERLALQSDDEQPLVSRYPFCCQLIGSQDFFALGVFDNQEIAYKNGLLYYKKSMAGQKVKVVYGTISEVLVGSMPLRSIDNKKNYNVIKWIVEEEEDRAS